MYLPPHFAETDETAIAEIIDAAPLAAVVAGAFGGGGGGGGHGGIRR